MQADLALPKTPIFSMMARLLQIAAATATD
jgi:hypothetical protein